MAEKEGKTKVKDTVAATGIEVKKTVRKAARGAKEAVVNAAEKVAGDVKFAVDEAKFTAEIEKGKAKAKAARKKDETAEKVEGMKQAAKKPSTKAKSAKLDIVLQSPMGGSITPEEIAQKVPAGTEKAYVRIDENKIYWVKKEETGSVDIW